MGSRRVSRKRLYEIEKQGQSISTSDMGTGAGIVDGIISATQHRQGQEIITEIAVDLGAAGTDFICGTGAGKACGLSGAAAQVAKLTAAKFGIVTEVRAVCVENCTRDIDVVLSTDDSYTQSQATSTGLQSVFAAGANPTPKGKDSSYESDNAAVFSIYFVDGDAAGAGVLNDGKFIIYVYGFEAPADL